MWFEHRFAALNKLEGANLKQGDAWKRERTDIPTDEEALKLFADDLKRFADLTAVEVVGRRYSGRLVPIVQRLPEEGKVQGEKGKTCCR